VFYYITDDDEIQYKEFQFQSFQTHAHIHRQGLYANLSIGEKLYYGRRRLTLHNIRIWDLHDENKGREGYLNELWQRLDIMYLHPRTLFIGFRRCVKTWATGAHGWHDVTIMSVSFRYVLRDSSPPASESCITKTIPTEEYQLGLEERTVEYKKKGEKKWPYRISDLQFDTHTSIARWRPVGELNNAVQDAHHAIVESYSLCCRLESHFFVALPSLSTSFSFEFFFFYRCLSREVFPSQFQRFHQGGAVRVCPKGLLPFSHYTIAHQLGRMVF
jgi:hypothetical protein